MLLLVLVVEPLDQHLELLIVTEDVRRALETVCSGNLLEVLNCGLEVLVLFVGSLSLIEHCYVRLCPYILDLNDHQVYFAWKVRMSFWDHAFIAIVGLFKMKRATLLIAEVYGLLISMLSAVLYVLELLLSHLSLTLHLLLIFNITSRIYSLCIIHAL